MNYPPSFFAFPRGVAAASSNSNPVPEGSKDAKPDNAAKDTTATNTSNRRHNHRGIFRILGLEVVASASVHGT